MKSEKRLGLHYAWWIMIGCCFLQAGALGLVLNSAGIFFTPVCTDLGFPQSGLAFYLTVYSWSTCVGMLLVARFFSRIDVRLTMSIAAALIAIAFGLMGTYSELWQWYISGAVFGVAGSFIFVVPAPVLIGNWFQKKTGFATGAAMAFSGIGAAVFSPLFTWVIGTMGWRTAYVICAIVMAVMVLPWTLFVFRFSPSDIGMKPYGWDASSGAEASEIAHGVPVKKALPTIAFLCLFLFAGLCSFYSGYNNQWPNFAISIGETAMFGATLISAAMIGNIVSKIAMGILSDILGVFTSTIVQLALVGIGMLMFVFVRHPAALYIAAFLYGIQNSLVSVSTPMLVKELFGGKYYSEIFAFIRLGTGIIGGIGLSFVAACYDAFGTYDQAFLIGAGISALGIICTLIAKSRKGSLVQE